MSKLYIANCTKQAHDFIYRVDNKMRQQQIGIGRQIIASGDLNGAQIENIVQQHRAYGLVSVGEIDRTKSFAGLCYSVDSPIAVDKIKEAIRHNDEILVERGHQLRKEAAIAANKSVEDNMPDQAKLDNFELTVVEDEHKDGTDSLVNETVSVSHNNPEQETKQSGGKSRNKSRGG